MPYHVTKTRQCPASKPWGVIKDSDGTCMGCHKTEGDAIEQLKALYANEPEARNEVGGEEWLRHQASDGRR